MIHLVQRFCQRKQTVRTTSKTALFVCWPKFVHLEQQDQTNPPGHMPSLQTKNTQFLTSFSCQCPTSFWWPQWCGSFPWSPLGLPLLLLLPLMITRQIVGEVPVEQRWAEINFTKLLTTRGLLSGSTDVVATLISSHNTQKHYTLADPYATIWQLIHTPRGALSLFSN